MTIRAALNKSEIEPFSNSSSTRANGVTFLAGAKVSLIRCQFDATVARTEGY